MEECGCEELITSPNFLSNFLFQAFCNVLLLRLHEVAIITNMPSIVFVFLKILSTEMKIDNSQRKVHCNALIYLEIIVLSFFSYHL